MTSLPSPCISICAIDSQTGWCTGCYRTRHEIGAWASLDLAGQKHILGQLIARKGQVTGHYRRRQSARPLGRQLGRQTGRPVPPAIETVHDKVNL